MTPASFKLYAIYRIDGCTFAVPKSTISPCFDSLLLQWTLTELPRDNIQIQTIRLCSVVCIIVSAHSHYSQGYGYHLSRYHVSTDFTSHCHTVFHIIIVFTSIFTGWLQSLYHVSKISHPISHGISHNYCFHIHFHRVVTFSFTKWVRFHMVFHIITVFTSIFTG